MLEDILSTISYGRISNAIENNMTKGRRLSLLPFVI